MDIYDRGDHRIYPPDRQLAWSAWSRSDTGIKPTTRINYGAAPIGLTNAVAPRELEIPGCYVVQAQGIDPVGDSRSAWVGFNVLSDGRVAELTKGELDRVYSQKKPVH
jgi:hypothetical protein